VRVPVECLEGEACSNSRKAELGKVVLPALSASDSRVSSSSTGDGMLPFILWLAAQGCLGGCETVKCVSMVVCLISTSLDSQVAFLLTSPHLPHTHITHTLG